ncbi:MAG: UDP-N-acetylmuramoyl-L-alanyl-D-glutamate--2,6-diaminopimelate ligase [Opitutaceae bacterium]
MSQNLNELFSGIDCLEIKGTLDRVVTSLVIDSRRATPGCVFFALPGMRSDGSFFIDEAIDRGAVAVISSQSRQFTPSGVTSIRVSRPRAVLAEVSRRFYRAPDEDLRVIGVTGTNGKTTVTHLVKHLLTRPGERVGLIGTISYDLGERTVPAFRTTPESVDVFGMLSQMRNAGCRFAAMEISSHGINQDRVRGLRLRTAAFLNLTRDHLDYHGSLEDYFQVKARLFTGEVGSLPEVAVVNIDDAAGRRLLGMIPQGVRTITFGQATDAEIRGSQVELGFMTTRFTLHWPDGEARIESPLLGDYNLSNLLASLAICQANGREIVSVLPRLESFGGIPGRMERIANPFGFNVLVDYAHTDDALRNAVQMLRQITPGRLYVVFGCGGNRDRTKRPAMTTAVQETADHAWATADNPRKEAVAAIFDDMRAGIIHPDRIQFVDDRRHAISLALDHATEGDCILIAGKGHESFQEFGDTIVPFDDRQVARELIEIKKLKPPQT